MEKATLIVRTSGEQCSSIVRTPDTARAAAADWPVSDWPLWSTKEACLALGISPETLARWVVAEGLPVIDIGRVRRFRPASVGAWLADRESAAPPPTKLLAASRR